MDTLHPLIVSLMLFSLHFTFSSGWRKPGDGASLVPLKLPQEIAAPPGNNLLLALRGVGLQHYAYNGSSWLLQRATADLYSVPDGRLVGRHFFLPRKDPKGGQPSWESFEPKSLVTAKSVSVVDVHSDSIPWVLLQATNARGNKEWFGKVGYVQRIRTKGGLPPSSTSKAKAGDTHATDYSAVYVFYVNS